MAPKLGFPKESPIYQIYQGLIRAGVRKERLDRGYTRIDYAQPGPNATQVNQRGVTEEPEVIDPALESDRFKDLVEGYLGRPRPWDVDEKIQGKINEALAVLKPLLDRLKRGSAEYEERLALALFYVADLPSDIDKEIQARYAVEKNLRSELEALGLEKFLTYLSDHGGLGIHQFNEDAPIEASAVESLQLKKGWCTERSKILFAFFKAAGLKPQFVFVPSRAVQQFAKAKGLEVSSLFRNQDHVAITLRFGQRIRIFDLALFDSDAKYQEYYLLGLRHFLAIDRNNRGLDLARMDRVHEAETEFNEAVRLDPESPDPHTNLCSFRPDERKLEELEVHCRMAIQLDPLAITPRYALGRHYAAYKKNREAIALFRELLKIDPLHIVARRRLAQLLEGEGLEMEAIQEYREAIRLEPNIPVSYYQLAQLLVKRGEMQEASSLYEKVVQLMPPPPPIYFHYGVALWCSGRPAEAVTALENLHRGMIKALDTGQITPPLLKLWLNKQMSLVTPEMKKDLEAMRPLAKLFLELDQRFQKEKRLEDANGALQKAYELDPTLKPSSATSTPSRP